MRSSRLQAIVLSAITIVVTALPTPEVGEDPKLNTIEKRAFPPAIAACILACTPLAIGGPAYALCCAGCMGLAESDGEIVGTPFLQTDGTVAFKQ